MLLLYFISRKRAGSLLLLYLFLSIAAHSQEVIDLYPGAIPNAKNWGKKENYGGGMFRGVSRPTLEIYLPEKEKSTGIGMIVVPGGGYGVVVYDGEGIATAKRLTQNGIAAFVLKYRLPDDSVLLNKTIGPLQDAQQAIKKVREGAAQWGVAKSKIGIIGFSAGGHLAATAATNFQRPLVENGNGTSLRPDFQVVVYPVISMQDSLTHKDSRSNLLGKDPSSQQKDLYSAELQVSAATPPAYITHATDDKLVDAGNSIIYFEALRRAGVPVEMHIVQSGGHGFIFRQPAWMEPLLLWLKKNKWME